MSNTQFTGPLIAGPIQFGASTVLGIDTPNVGYCEMVQSVAITQAGSIAALKTTITIPAFSQIIGIELIEGVQWSAGNLSVGTTVLANELVTATAVNATFRATFVPASAPQGALWLNVGSTDVSIWALSSTGSGGTGNLIVRYIQQLNTSTL